MTRVCVLFMGLSLTVRPVASQGFITASPPVTIVFRGVVDDPITSFTVALDRVLPTPGPVQTIGISGSVQGLKFKFDHVESRLNSPPNFIVITPSSGTIPALLQVGLNDAIIRRMSPGSYGLGIVFSTVDQSPSSSASVTVQLSLSAPPAPAIQSVVSTASYQPNLSPGAMVSIFGTHLGQPSGSAPYDEFGLYPTSLAGTTVTFNGIAAPLLYASASQINALVPYGLAGQNKADVIVTRVIGSVSQSSSALNIQITDTSPAIFTSTQNGRGQGTFLQYPDSSYNSADNPAPPGSVVTLFATGAGVWNPPVLDGVISLAPLNVLPPRLPWFSAQPVSLTIGGQPARIIYAGGVLYQVWGLLQINAVVPDNVASGTQPVILTIGQNNNSEQKVTIAIK